MRFRAVSWILFPVLAAVFFIAGIIDKGLDKYLVGTGIALLLIMIQMLLILLVFTLRKNKEKKGFINHVFGLGDLLLFVVLCFAFSPFNLVLFLTLSSIITMGIYLPLTILKKDSVLKIPLAGMISLAYVLFIIPLRRWYLNVIP
ncbi:MAG: hypothetical protein U5Q03_18005 [Bacteroidota bacterium]|nr:hypothetical protein [Bacteroidota bacterium]